MYQSQQTPRPRPPGIGKRRTSNSKPLIHHGPVFSLSSSNVFGKGDGSEIRGSDSQDNLVAAGEAPPPYPFPSPSLKSQTLQVTHARAVTSGGAVGSPLEEAMKMLGVDVNLEANTGATKNSVDEGWIQERSREELSRLLLEAERLIRERERDLSLAAAIGQSLLEKNISLRNKHETLLATLPDSASSPQLNSDSNNHCPQITSTPLAKRSRAMDGWSFPLTDSSQQSHQVPAVISEQDDSHTRSPTPSSIASPLRATSRVAQRFASRPNHSPQVSLAVQNQALHEALTDLQVTTSRSESEGRKKLRNLEREIKTLQEALKASEGELERRVDVAGLASAGNSSRPAQKAWERRKQDNMMNDLEDQQHLLNESSMTDFAPPKPPQLLPVSFNLDPESLKPSPFHIPIHRTPLKVHFPSTLPSEDNQDDSVNQTTTDGPQTPVQVSKLSTSTASSPFTSPQAPITRTRHLSLNFPISPPSSSPMQQDLVQKLLGKIEELQKANIELKAEHREVVERVSQVEEEGRELEGMIAASQVGTKEDSEDQENGQLTRPKGNQSAIRNIKTRKRTHSTFSTLSGPQSPNTTPVKSAERENVSLKMPIIKASADSSLSSLADTSPTKSRSSSGQLRHIPSISSLGGYIDNLRGKTLESELGREYGEDWAGEFFGSPAGSTISKYSSTQPGPFDGAVEVSSGSNALQAVRDVIHRGPSPYQPHAGSILPHGSLIESPPSDVQTFDLLSTAIETRPTTWADSEAIPPPPGAIERIVDWGSRRREASNIEPFDENVYPEAEDEGKGRFQRLRLRLQGNLDSPEASRRRITHGTSMTTLRIEAPSSPPEHHSEDEEFELVNRPRNSGVPYGPLSFTARYLTPSHVIERSIRNLLEIWMFVQFCLVLCVVIWRAVELGPRDVLRSSGDGPRRRIG